MPRLKRREEPKEPLDLNALGHRVESWWGIKYQSKLINKKLEEDKKALQAIVERHGQMDPESGSIFLDLDEPVSDRKICTLKAQAAVGQGLSLDAEEILKELGIWDDCVEMVPQLSQSLVYTAYYDNKITQNDLDRLFPQKKHYSFILLDDAGKPVN